MTDQTEGFLVVPLPGTDEMVELLGMSLDSMFDQLRAIFPFSHGDAMSACMYSVVESGLANVSPEQLRSDVIAAVDRIIAEVQASKSKKH